jgi:hypothetical protein
MNVKLGSFKKRQTSNPAALKLISTMFSTYFSKIFWTRERQRGREKGEREREREEREGLMVKMG